MKKKTLSILIAVVCMLCCVFGLTGCSMFDKLFNRDGGDDGVRNEWQEPEVTSIHCSYNRLDFNEIDIGYNHVRLQIVTNTNKTLYDADVYWWSDDPEVATVDSEGLVTPVALGVTTIHAEYQKMEATCRVSVGGEHDDNKGDDDQSGNGGSQGTTPTQGALDGKTFEFYDLTCDEEYQYLNSMKQGYTGTTIAFDDGVCTVNQGNMTYSGAYTLGGGTVSVTVSEVSSSYLASVLGSTVEYIYADDELTQDGVLSASASGTGQELHLHFVFRLQTIGGIGDMSGELRGKSFVFDRMTSTILDSSAVNSINVGYSGAVVTFGDNGAYVLVINAEHSIQYGTYFFNDGEGYMNITRIVVDGEEQEIITGTYQIELSGNVLTMSAAEMVFTYILAD